ncbi:LysE family translocator [Sulfurimonas sp. HSL1-2]|uniref:LysE family translocator n=1 Tax=Thiomicrolovo zhangzhouensis TaxID=3131933 RepID=UPI0031F8C486
MTFYSIAGLSAAMFVLAVTPGPGVFITVSKALASGFRNTLPVIAGIVTGDLIFLLFAIFGLAAISETFETMFLIIKYLGAGYLIWLGIKLWRSHPEKMEITASKKHRFLSGLSITLGNPKVILFYLGFLPTFVDLNALSSLDVFSIAFIVSSILGAVMSFYAYSASRARQLFKNERTQKQMNEIAGSVMIGTGSLLLYRT